MNQRSMLSKDFEVANTPRTPSQMSLFEDDSVPSVSRPIVRPIHYLGSKLRIVENICQIVDSIDATHGPILDLFSGSGTVSLAMSRSRDVVAVDIQEYSRVICSALLHPVDSKSISAKEFVRDVLSSECFVSLKQALEPMVELEQNFIKMAKDGQPEPLCDLLECGSIIVFQQTGCSVNSAIAKAMSETISRLTALRLDQGTKSMISRYFGGVYFSYSQACQMDALLEFIWSRSIIFRDTLLAALLSTASELVNTIGKQFAQPLRPRSRIGRPKPELFDLVARDRLSSSTELYQDWLSRYLSLPNTGRNHRAIREDYVEALRDEGRDVAVIYADPPYTRDHYSRYYHVLETMCLRDNPSISLVKLNGHESPSRGVYRLNRHQSPFCIHSKAPAAFASLFEGARKLGVPLLVSYSPYSRDNRSRPRLMTIDQIRTLAKTYFDNVETLSAGQIAHSKLTSSDKLVSANHEAEVLIVCQP